MTTKYPATLAHKFLNLPNGTLGVYNSWDSWTTARLGQVGVKYLQRNGQWDFWTSHIAPLQGAVYRMQQRGLLIDKKALRALRARVTQELVETDAVVLAADPTGDLAHPTPNAPNGLGSPKRLGRFLFTTLGLPVTKKTERGMDSTDQEALYSILRTLRKRDEPLRPVLEALFHRTRWSTIRKRYLQPPVGPDGRVRPTVKMWGTKTLRFAVKDPALQQAPQETRHIYRARPGHCFVSVDYKQLEARLLAYLAHDKPSIAAFDRGEDIHWANACDLFGWFGDRPVEKPARNFAKSFLYGLSYGGQAETMKTKLFCPCSKCAADVPPTFVLGRVAIRAAEDKWFAAHPAVRKFQSALASQIQRDHAYRHPLGYLRMISAPWSSELDRETKNLPMQLGGAILMARAQIELDTHHQAPVIFQHHDSFLLETPLKDRQHWSDTTREAMERPVPELGGIVFPTDAEWGLNWGGQSERNPDGMRPFDA